MEKNSVNYKYLVRSPRDIDWGITVDTVGSEPIPPKNLIKPARFFKRLPVNRNRDDRISLFLKFSNFFLELICKNQAISIIPHKLVSCNVGFHVFVIFVKRLIKKQLVPCFFPSFAIFTDCFFGHLPSATGT